MTTQEKLSLREKVSYGFGDFASCLYWQTISVYLAIFYTDIFGITALAAGTMIGLSRSFDAIFDVVIGMLADRTNSRWGKFRPYLLYTCVPMAVIGFLTFTVPDFDEKGKLIWAYATFNVLMLIYTTINIPYTAMLGVLTPSSTERTALSSIKFVGAFAGGIVVSATLLPMAKVGGWLGATTSKQGWQMSFVVIGVASILSFLIVFFNTKERVLPPKEQKTSVLKDLGDLVTNRPWLVLLATTITFIFYVALRGNAIAHYFKYFVGTQTITLPAFLPASMAGTQSWGWETLVSVFNTSTQLLSLVGAMLVPLLVRKVGSKPAFVMLFVIAILATASFYILKPEQLVLIFVLNGIGSITGGPLSALLWAMYADTADYAEWKTGRRATGLVFSASIFSQKFGWGWGGGLSLIMLNGVGFVANQVQSPAALHGLVKLMSIFPAAFGILAILVLVIFYPLNEARMAEISADLKTRRGKRRRRESNPEIFSDTTKASGARLLPSGRVCRVGAMRPQVLLVFLTRFEESMAMLKGIAHYERTHQIWAAFHDDQARAETEPHWLRAKKWHGVISRHTTPGLVQVCAELKIPLIDLNDVPVFPGVPKIRPDNVGLGHLGAEHFLERGHQHFGFTGFSNYEWSCERRDGFVEALRLAGRDCDVFDVTYPGDLTPVWDTAQISTLAGWLKRLPKPAGVMACMDLRAQQVISAAQNSNILVPEEVAILGVNNDPIRCELAYPPLSSVAPNAFQSGYRAAETLAEILAGNKPANYDQRIEPVGVVARQSSDVLAIDDRNVAAALSFIRERACHGITVDQVVRHAFSSRSQLEKKFRRHLGRSPQAEIRRMQVGKIRQLLFETDFPLKKIAELTGFEHVEYMCVLFKRLNGDSPGKYRKKSQSELAQKKS